VNHKTTEYVMKAVCAGAIVLSLAGCGNSREKASGTKTAGSPRTDPTFSVLTREIQKTSGSSATLAAVRKSGLLKVSFSCSRPPLCYQNKLGVPRGFEVDLLRQIASAFGVKLNIVAPGEPAPIEGPAAANSGVPGGDLIPYYYSESTGWLALKVNGDDEFHRGVALVIRHLYETGTFQQLFLMRMGVGEGTAGAESELE